MMAAQMVVTIACAYIYIYIYIYSESTKTLFYFIKKCKQVHFNPIENKLFTFMTLHADYFIGRFCDFVESQNISFDTQYLKCIVFQLYNIQILLYTTLMCYDRNSKTLILEYIDIKAL